MVKTETEKNPNEMGDKSDDNKGDDNKSPKKQQQKPAQQRTGKGLICEVVLLDGEHINIELDRNAEGKDLLDKVCHHLDLIEKDYFGIQYIDERISNRLKCWLSPDKKITKQKKGAPWLFDFALKFYPPDPTQLKESLTRWLVVLQCRRDILSGKLPTTFLTQAMLGSYNVQADVGDFDPSEHRGIEYIRDTCFAPNQNTDLLEKIVELHKQHKGQTPDEAELNYLENAKKLSMYGVDLHAAQDADNVDIMLGVCASGLQVYREKLRISRFVWPKILKICYKRRHFYVKVRPTDSMPTDNTVSFKLASHRLAKRLWKICVEHHAFFRLRESEQTQNPAMFPRLGSKFRYSGRTLYQTRQSSQILERPNPYFERSQPAHNTFGGANTKSRSMDELSNRPDYWKDDEENKNKPGGKDERDRKDRKDDPNATARKAGMEDSTALGSGAGSLAPGANKSMDGRDRQDRKPGEDDSTLDKEGAEGTMGLTPAELQKRAKEEEKERKKREKEEEKRRKKEEEDRKKAEKAAAKKKGKGGDPSTEDRKDVTAGGDATLQAHGRTPGSHSDQDGGSAYPFLGAGLLVDGGDMSGVVGDESWVDNKMRFEPIMPPKAETKQSLKSGLHGIDHTMPYFSPDATSTVGRPGKGGLGRTNPYDDSYDRTDMYKNNKDGIQETRVQHTKVLSSADDEDFDYDAALADAIRSVTEFNPDMSVERIECVQQIEDSHK